MKRRVSIAAATFLGCLSLIARAHLHQARHTGRVIFDEFPQTAGLFQPDVRPFIDQIISRHGPEEWETVVLTSEFHAHLGIYSIIGAKMGLRAREYFDADRDGLTVLSFAGRRPPISCLNDGIQASTGATLGHGTISLADSPTQIPKAHFTRGNTTICLELKQAYWQEVKDDIKKLIERHGANSDDYWLSVRQLGIRYWADWSRDDIFDLTVVPTEQRRQRPACTPSRLRSSGSVAECTAVWCHGCACAAILPCHESVIRRAGQKTINFACGESPGTVEFPRGPV